MLAEGEVKEDDLLLEGPRGAGICSRLTPQSTP